MWTAKEDEDYLEQKWTKDRAFNDLNNTRNVRVV